MIPQTLLSDKYLLSLVITLITEGIIVLILFRNLRNIFSSIIINIISHPWAYFSVIVLHAPFWVVEGLVFIFEAFIWASVFRKTQRQAILISFLTNMVSILVGFIASAIL
jgi:hypothetical protein